MGQVEFVPYNDKNHKTDVFEMFVEYGYWLDNQVFTHYGLHLFANGDVKKACDTLVPRFTAYSPSEGIILLLTVDNKTAGMVRLSKYDENIGSIHNVYIYPEFRGRGYSKLIMYELEKRAKELGYLFLRLDTGGFNHVAQSLYKKLGYIEIDRYTDFENLKDEVKSKYYLDKVYMEKQL